MVVVFFFNDPATTEIYTLSLHDALPICRPRGAGSVHPGHAGPGPAAAGCRRGAGAARAPAPRPPRGVDRAVPQRDGRALDRKSTRLNSSHANISYAVFCLKKKITT